MEHLIDLASVGVTTHCCDLTFRAFRALIPNLEHLYIIEVLMHANAAIMFKDCTCSL